MSRRPLILMYHRIADPATDPWQLCVSPAHFREQLAVMRRHGRVVPLGELLPGGAGPGPRREGDLAITFDDGYADNLQARDLLEREDAPATVFVTTGYVGGGREFWWDELERVLLQPGDLPAALHLALGGSPVSVPLGEAARYSRDDARRHRGWRALEDEPPGPRQAAYLSLWKQLAARPAAEQRRALDVLVAHAGLDRAPRGSHRPLDREEVVELARSPLIEVGAHSVTHPVLPNLPLPAQREEITRSKAELEAMTGEPVQGFAYPHGRYTADAVGLVREAGFRYACAVRPQPDGPDPFLLPRVPVGDWDGDTFDRMLRHGFQD